MVVSTSFTDISRRSRLYRPSTGFAGPLGRQSSSVFSVSSQPAQTGSDSVLLAKTAQAVSEPGISNASLFLKTAAIALPIAAIALWHFKMMRPFVKGLEREAGSQLSRGGIGLDKWLAEKAANLAPKLMPHKFEAELALAGGMVSEGLSLKIQTPSRSFLSFMASKSSDSTGEELRFYNAVTTAHRHRKSLEVDDLLDVKAAIDRSHVIKFLTGKLPKATSALRFRGVTERLMLATDGDLRRFYALTRKAKPPAPFDTDLGDGVRLLHRALGRDGSGWDPLKYNASIAQAAKKLDSLRNDVVSEIIKRHHKAASPLRILLGKELSNLDSYSSQQKRLHACYALYLIKRDFEISLREEIPEMALGNTAVRVPQISAADYPASIAKHAWPLERMLETYPQIKRSDLRSTFDDIYFHIDALEKLLAPPH